MTQTYMGDGVDASAVLRFSHGRTRHLTLVRHSHEAIRGRSNNPNRGEARCRAAEPWRRGKVRGVGHRPHFRAASCATTVLTPPGLRLACRAGLFSIDLRLIVQDDAEQ